MSVPGCAIYGALSQQQHSSPGKFQSSCIRNVDSRPGEPIPSQVRTMCFLGGVVVLND